MSDTIHPRDAGIEAWLSSFGLTADRVSWEPGTPVEAIDAKQSLKNQARLEGKLDRDHVETLALSILDGAVMPPLIAYRDEHGRLVLIDGNHRLAGAVEAERPRVDVYVVPAQDRALIDLMTRSCNAATVGKTVGREHALEHAYVLLDQGYALEEVARRLRLRPTSLGDKKRERDVRRRLRRVGVKDPEAITASTAARLCQLQSDVQLKAVAEHIVGARMSLDAATDLVRRVRSAGSDARALEIVQAEQRAYDERLAAIKATSQQRAVEPAARRIARFLGAVRTALLSGKTPHALGYDRLEEVERTRAVLADVNRAADVVLSTADRQIRPAS